jgi:serine/threonine protein phosphatase PrpC
MGLAHPIGSQNIESITHGAIGLDVAAVECQGKRPTMEDKHLIYLPLRLVSPPTRIPTTATDTIIDNETKELTTTTLPTTTATPTPTVALTKTDKIDKNNNNNNDEQQHPNDSSRSLFGIFDGHGGDAVAHYLHQIFASRVVTMTNDDIVTPSKWIHLCQHLDQQWMNSEFAGKDGSTMLWAVITTPSSIPSTTPTPSTTASTTGGSTDEIRKWQLTIGHIGDSRALLIDHSGHIRSLTNDHIPTLPMERERIINAGGRVCGAAGEPNGNRVDGILGVSRSIGDWPFKDDSKRSQMEQKVIPLPDIVSMEVNIDDCLLLAWYSQGLI